MHPDEPTTPRQLREFALTLGALFAVVFGLAWPWLSGRPWPLWPWAVLAILAAWALVHPASLRPLHGAWMKLAEALGFVNNRIVLGILFFAVVTPIGLVRRLFAKDAMDRAFDPAAPSYRKPKRRRDPASLERPF